MQARLSSYKMDGYFQVQISCQVSGISNKGKQSRDAQVQASAIGYTALAP